MIDASDLHLGSVLNGISLHVEPGQCLGVLGRNGAGKSTLMATLAGVLRAPSGGLQRIEGAAYLPEGAPLDAGISVRAWLRIAPELPGWDEALGREVIEAFPLPLKRDASQLSQGQRVQLGLILTLGRRAPAYLLDDPFLGLDPVAKSRAERLIADRSVDVPVVLAGQDADAIERLCSHVTLLVGGRQVWLAETDAWRERYVGLRVVGEPPSLTSLRVLRQRSHGGATELFLDDPDHTALTQLRTAGADVTALPLRFDEVLELAVSA